MSLKPPLSYNYDLILNTYVRHKIMVSMSIALRGYSQNLTIAHGFLVCDHILSLIYESMLNSQIL